MHSIGLLGHGKASQRIRCPNRFITSMQNILQTQTIAQIVPYAIQHKLEVYSVSDLHTDHADNMRWVQQHCMEPQLQEDSSTIKVLIVAGDISDDLEKLSQTLSLLRRHYSKVIFIPGNHELWISSLKDGIKDSVEKLNRVIKICQEVGVETGPCSLGPRLLILPLHSWHHASFDRERDIGPAVPKASPFTLADWAKTSWPSWVYDSFQGEEESKAQGSLSIALWADSLNGQNISHRVSEKSFVITFSHFVPNQKLVPEKRYLSYPNLCKAVGSEPLGLRIQAMKPNIHIFAHHHFAWDMKIEDTRFISAPLCYPRERSFRMRSISISSPWQKGPDADGDGSDIDDRMPCLPLLIYRARFVSDGKIDDTSRGSAESSTPYKDLLGLENVLDWKGEECPYPLGGAMWSKYYRMNKRDPDNVEMAPWVKGRYLKRLQRLQDSI